MTCSRQTSRLLFARTSVFAGGWSLEGAEAVGAGDAVAREDVLDLLARLVEKSLVMAEELGGRQVMVPATGDAAAVWTRTAGSG